MNGVLALVLCALGWSLGGVFLKYVNGNSLAIAGMRSFIAFFGLMIVTRRLPKFVVREEDSSGSKKIDVKSTVNMWLGGIFYALTMILYCVGNKMTTAANTTLLQYTAPIYVIILGPLLLGEKNRWTDYLTVAGVIAGMLLFFSDALFFQGRQEFNKIYFWGNVVAVFSGVAYALCTIFIRKVKGLRGASQNCFILAQLVAFIICLPFIIQNGLPDRQSLIFLLLLGFFQMAIPNALYAHGVKSVSALSAILITMIEPLMNPVWVAVFVGEVPAVTCVIGGVIIMLCILVREIINNKARKRDVEYTK